MSVSDEAISLSVTKPQDQFRLVNGFPTEELLFNRDRPKLTEIKATGSYDSVAEYVKIHYDLLLEDFMSPLWETVQNVNASKFRSVCGGRVYFNIRLTSINEVTRRCLIALPKHVRLHLNENKHLTFGRLLLLAKKDFVRGRIFFAEIIEDTTDKEYDNIVLKLHIPNNSLFSLDDLHEGPFTAIESTAFYFAYKEVLSVLDSISERSFPMSRYIIYGNEGTEVSPPKYLTRETIYKFGSENVPVLDQSKWPTCKDLHLDKSQYGALKKALTEELVLIQGPPGTGKTYFGVTLVKVLLDNIQVWNPRGVSPLLVICQSNLAVDHFMEGILKYTDKIVRVGSRSESKKLKPFALVELVCRWAVKSFPDHRELLQVVDHLRNLDRARRQLEELTKGIVSYTALRDFKGASVFESEEKYLEWLGLDIKIEEKVFKEDSILVVSRSELLLRINQSVLAGDFCNADELKVNLVKVEKLVAQHSKGIKQMVPLDVNDILSFSSYNASTLYLYWISEFSKQLQNQTESSEDGLHILWRNVLPRMMKEKGTYEVLKSAQVVGLTATGAAVRQYILSEIGSQIIVVDEAAELLEAFTIASVTKRCKHLILLGDHKQLKPSLNTPHLADFNLDLSLFERLQRNKIVTGTCLTTQYRMKPEFCALLKPHFYEVLNNAAGVCFRPPVRGVSKSLFFLNHKHLEERVFDFKVGTWNPHEVVMMIHLAQYLVSMGYAPIEITIITMYNLQKKKLIEARDKIPVLGNMEISSVDSFQGKENEIILLSLVRSNTTGNIGFLQQENRACVALSRARQGFFIMGNMECLKKGGKVWQHVSEVLEKKNAIGKQLKLSCEKHKTDHKVSREEHWRTDFCHQCRREKTPQVEKTPENKFTGTILKMTAAEMPAEIESWAGKSAEIESSAGKPPAEIESSAGKPPAEIESMAEKLPAEIESRAGKPPAEIESRTGKPPAEIESRAGKPPAEIESRAGNPPAKIESRAGNPPAEIESRAEKPPARVESRAEKPPADIESRAGTSSETLLKGESETILVKRISALHAVPDPAENEPGTAKPSGSSLANEVKPNPPKPLKKTLDGKSAREPAESQAGAEKTPAADSLASEAESAGMSEDMKNPHELPKDVAAEEPAMEVAGGVLQAPGDRPEEEFIPAVAAIFDYFSQMQIRD